MDENFPELSKLKGAGSLVMIPGKVERKEPTPKHITEKLQGWEQRGETEPLPEKKGRFPSKSASQTRSCLSGL